MRDDAKYILSKIAAGSNVNLVPRSMDTRQESSNKHLRLYDTVPVNDIHELLAFYEDDFKVFGYELPERIRRRLHS